MFFLELGCPHGIGQHRLGQTRLQRAAAGQCLRHDPLQTGIQTNHTQLALAGEPLLHNGTAQGHA